MSLAEAEQSMCLGDTGVAGTPVSWPVQTALSGRGCRSGFRSIAWPKINKNDFCKYKCGQGIVKLKSS